MDDPHAVILQNTADDAKLDELLDLAARIVESKSSYDPKAKYQLILELLANDAQCLLKMSPPTRQKVLAAARELGLLKKGGRG